MITQLCDRAEWKHFQSQMYLHIIPSSVLSERKWTCVSDVIRASPEARPSNGTPQGAAKTSTYGPTSLTSISLDQKLVLQTVSPGRIENLQAWTHVKDVTRASSEARLSNGTPQGAAKTFTDGPTSVTSVGLGQKLAFQMG